MDFFVSRKTLLSVVKNVQTTRKSSEIQVIRNRFSRETTDLKEINEKENQILNTTQLQGSKYKGRL